MAEPGEGFQPESDTGTQPERGAGRVSSLRHTTGWRRTILIVALVVLLVALLLECLFLASAIIEVGCSLCHRPSLAAGDLSHSSHAEATCRSCHKLPGVAGAVRYNLQAGDNLVSWVLHRSGHEVDGSVLVSNRCMNCHPEVITQVVQVQGVRMSHAQVSPGSSSGAATTRLGSPNVQACTLCHSEVAHRAPPGGTGGVEPHSFCVGCHDGLQASSDCSTCHVAANPLETAHLTATDAHPANWPSSHGLGDSATCTICHKPTECVTCHGVELPHQRDTFIYTHGTDALENEEACFACHSKAACDGCHQVPMPHPDQYLRLHGPDANAKGVEVCATCHTESGCQVCHLKHIHPGVPQKVIDKLEAQTESAGSTP